MPEHWSHSQLQLWQGCGKRYELERIKKVPTPPAWYLIAGKAIHAALDLVDLGDLRASQELWGACFDQEISQASYEEPDEALWASARGNQRGDYWFTKGVEHVDRWIEFREQNPQLQLVTIEEEVSYGTGTGEIKAYLDRVFHDTDDDSHLLIDIKSGSRRPESTQQLGIYKALWDHKHPARKITRAHYFMTKDSGFHPKQPPDLSAWTLDTLDRLGEQWNRAKEAQVFLPVVSSSCETCSVRKACYVVSGDTETTRVYDELNPNFEGET